METIPTAEEFLKEKYQADLNSFQDNVEHLKEFAEMHVKAALKEARRIVEESNGESILNAYPLDNIK